jgi:hypothetical protein
MSARILVAVVVAAAALSLPALAGAATLSGTASGGQIPSAGASVRAVNALTGRIADTARLRPGGRFALRVPAGPHVVLTTVPLRTGVRRAITPVVWPRRAGSRVRVPVSLRRTKPVRPRPARRATVRARTAARALQVIPAPVVAVKPFLTQGPNPFAGAGLADLVVGDLLDAGTDACRPRLVEWARRADVPKERDFWRSGYVDRRSLPTGTALRPQVFVEGFVFENADGSGRYEIRLTDARTGETLGGDHAAYAAGAGVFAASPGIADRLADQLCGGAYDVTLDVTTDATFELYTASGRLTSTVTATPTALGGPGIGTSFFGDGPLGYRANVFTSNIGCPYTGIVPIDGSWGISLEVTDAGRLQVTWLSSAGGPRVTASISCPGSPPIPGQPGANLLQPEPARFEVPVAGGSVDVTGGFREGPDGWTHRGILVVRRVQR